MGRPPRTSTSRDALRLSCLADASTLTVSPDPNGIALEASYWLRNPTTVDGVRGEPIFTDADPVPAVREIVESGSPEWTPRTVLVDEGIDPA